MRRLKDPGNPRKRSRSQNQLLSPTYRPFANSFSTRSKPVGFLVDDLTETYIDHRIISNALHEMNYDANKLPLGSFHPLSSMGRFVDESARREAG